eukprot:750967-Hanusia_phi.AAC.2
MHVLVPPPGPLSILPSPSPRRVLPPLSPAMQVDSQRGLITGMINLFAWPARAAARPGGPRPGGLVTSPVRRVRSDDGAQAYAGCGPNPRARLPAAGPGPHWAAGPGRLAAGPVTESAGRRAAWRPEWARLSTAAAVTRIGLVTVS